jgi:hypothetical protein
MTENRRQVMFFGSLTGEHCGILQPVDRTRLHFEIWESNTPVVASVI